MLALPELADRPVIVFGRPVRRALHAMSKDPEWVWTMALGHEKAQTYGYQGTKKAALEAFARNWHRQT
jgi:hypothetical protein